MDDLPKAILFDVDGTLTNTQKVVSVQTVKVLSQLGKKGIKLGVATGRSYASILGYILPFFPKDSLHIVAGGGQIVDARGAVIWEKKISHKEVVNICKETERMGASYVFGQGPILYCSKKILPNISQHPWKIETRHTDQLKDWSTPLISILEINENVRKFLFEKKNLSVREIETSYQPPYIDITAKGVNKGSTANIWANNQGVSLRDVLAIGDSINDLELMRVVGLSAAMGQSPLELKSVSQTTIGDTDEDGLVKYLEKLFKL